LREMGAWLAIHGDSLYGTRRGPWVWNDWGVSTHRGRTAYMHVLKRAGGELRLPQVPANLLSVKRFTGEPMDFALLDSPERGKEIAITMPVWDDQRTTDLILKLEFDAPLDGLWLSEPARRGEDGVIRLRADRAELHGRSIAREGDRAWKWSEAGDFLVWSVVVPTAGQYHVMANYACSQAAEGGTLRASCGASSTTGGIVATDGDTGSKTGTMTLDQPLDLPAGTSWVRVEASGTAKPVFIHLMDLLLRDVTVTTGPR